MPALHGDLADTDEYFGALDELLRTGATAGLMDTPPAERDLKARKPIAYEPGPPRYPMPEEAAHPLMGRSKHKGMQAPLTTLEVKVKAMDLRFVTQPIMVGHYEQDTISGAESIIDRDLVDHALSERYNLGLYAGPVGTAVVVLRPPNDAERLRGSLCGTVVTGLGQYDGTLSANTLTEAVRAGALRYLLEYVDCSGRRSGELQFHRESYDLGFGRGADSRRGRGQHQIQTVHGGLLEHRHAGDRRALSRQRDIGHARANGSRCEAQQEYRSSRRSSEGVAGVGSWDGRPATTRR
jgi:hypothetical protein